MSTPLTPEQQHARNVLLNFTPARPMIVSPSVHKVMLAQPWLSDLMDRVQVSRFLLGSSR